MACDGLRRQLIALGADVSLCAVSETLASMTTERPSGRLTITSGRRRRFSSSVKVVCLLLLGLNVCAFYALEARRVLTLGPGDDAPPRAKAFAAVSLTLLVAIMCAGRMLTFYRP